MRSLLTLTFSPSPRNPLTLSSRYHELQGAHMVQAKIATDEESREGKLALYRNTIKTQEQAREGRGGGLTYVWA